MKPIDQLQTDAKEVLATVLTLTDEHKKALRFLIDEKLKMAQQASQHKEDVKALAEKLGTKSGKVAKMIAIIIQEEEKGGVLKEQSSVLDWVNQFLGREEE
jgi:hypothetical protein